MRLWVSNIPYYWSTIELEKIFSVSLLVVSTSYRFIYSNN